MKFKTEIEAIQFFLDAEIVVGSATIQMIKDKGYIENSIVDEAEDFYEQYKGYGIDYSKIEYLNAAINIFHVVIKKQNDAIQYLKSEVQELKDDKDV